MLAAYTHFHPHNGRFGQPLARVARALQAWARLVPPLGRIPPAYPMVCGIVAALILLGRPDMAVAVLIAMSAYLRPGELCVGATWCRRCRGSVPSTGRGAWC